MLEPAPATFLRKNIQIIRITRPRQTNSIKRAAKRKPNTRSIENMKTTTNNINGHKVVAKYESHGCDQVWIYLRVDDKQHSDLVVIFNNDNIVVGNGLEDASDLFSSESLDSVGIQSHCQTYEELSSTLANVFAVEISTACSIRAEFLNTAMPDFFENLINNVKLKTKLIIEDQRSRECDYSLVNISLQIETEEGSVVIPLQHHQFVLSVAECDQTQVTKLLKHNPESCDLEKLLIAEIRYAQNEFVQHLESSAM
jgi:hypothetical protein